jgi:hypothetical protein
MINGDSDLNQLEADIETPFLDARAGTVTVAPYASLHTYVGADTAATASRDAVVSPVMILSLAMLIILMSVASIITLGRQFKSLLVKFAGLSCEVQRCHPFCIDGLSL